LVYSREYVNGLKSIYFAVFIDHSRKKS